MLTNYIKIAWRNLMKSKAFSLINILGLTIGITVCLMIFLFIMNEFSIDSFQANGNRTYRVMRSFSKDNMKVPYLAAPYAPALLNDFGGAIKRAVRVCPTNDLFVIGQQSFNEKKVYLADAGFFELFSFPLVTGNKATALKEPNSIVLTETIAKKYFGTVDKAMGSVIEMDKSRQLKVTGIAKDVPSASHLSFDVIVPLSGFEKEQGFTRWINNNLFVYVQLADGVDAAALQTQFRGFMEKYMGHDMKQFGYDFTLSLTPLKDIYFEDMGPFDNVKHGDKTVVYIFLSIAVLILLIACINFMNLSTIRAVERSKEVGLRKVLGALRTQLVWQFLGESILITLVSCLLSVGLLQLLMPWYNGLLGYSLTVSWNAAPVYLFLLSVILIVGLLAGSYPAIFLSAFSPIQALKGKLRLGKGGFSFRQTLVVVQFSISVLLILGTIVINNQMSYVKNKQLGYNQEQTVVIPIDNNDFYNNRIRFKKELEANSNIAAVSMMSGEPGGFFDKQTFDVEGKTEKWQPRSEFADFEFVKALGLNIVAGRNLSSQYPTDSTSAVLINETAANNLGWSPQEAVGKWLKNSIRDSLPRTIVGVVKDFNFLSLKENMDALVISPSEDRRVALVKLASGKLENGLEAIKKEYASVAPQYPLEYSFLDEKFAELYKKDLRQQSILTVFAGLAIFVACLGLFGLASFTATKRYKEIGVRKVLGSSVQNIVILLSKDLLKPVAIATCIALPIGCWAMDKWLQSFAYKTSVSWWIFLLAAAITFGIALLTVCLKAIRAAIANPIKSLRTE